MSAPTDAPARCGTCAHAKPGDEPTGIMRDANFVNCAFMGKFEYRSAYWPCVFSPPRWQAKEENADLPCQSV